MFAAQYMKADLVSSVFNQSLLDTDLGIPSGIACCASRSIVHRRPPPPVSSRQASPHFTFFYPISSLLTVEPRATPHLALPSFLLFLPCVQSQPICLSVYNTMLLGLVNIAVRVLMVNKISVVVGASTLTAVAGSIFTISVLFGPKVYRVRYKYFGTYRERQSPLPT